MDKKTAIRAGELLASIEYKQKEIDSLQSVLDDLGDADPNQDYIGLTFYWKRDYITIPTPMSMVPEMLNLSKEKQTDELNELKSEFEAL